MTQNAINNSASSIDIDNINIDGNTISSTDTNGNVILAPDGTGAVEIDNINIVGNTISSTDTNGDIILDPDGTGTVQVAYGTQNAITTYGASGALDEVGPLTNGQLPIGSTGNPPSAATLASANSAVTITNGAGTIDLSAKIVQYVIASNTTSGSTTNDIPFDSTIPQVTEGAEIMTISITPKSASNLLLIDSRIAWASNTPSVPVLALFQDAGTSAISAIPVASHSLNNPQMGVFLFDMIAGTTSSTTFKMRGGPQFSTQTFYWNRSSTITDLYGVGTFRSRMIIYELEV